MQKYVFAIMIICPGMFAFAQPAVRNEPRHHNVFENEYARVLDVYLAPNDTTQFHVHATPSVFITFTKNITGAQLMGQQPARTTSVAGYTWFDSLATPRIHRVWNEDSTWFHVMDIELTGGQPAGNESPLKNSSLQLLFNESLVIGYLVQLQAGSGMQLPPSPRGYLLISLGDAVIDYGENGTVQHRIMKAGHYIWIKAGKASSITAGNHMPATFTLLQLK
jgi:hypothetical protein